MNSLASLRSLVILAATLASTTYASIGPVTDLHIVNAELSQVADVRAAENSTFARYSSGRGFFERSRVLFWSITVEPYPRSGYIVLGR